MKKIQYLCGKKDCLFFNHFNEKGCIKGYIGTNNQGDCSSYEQTNNQKL